MTGSMMAPALVVLAAGVAVWPESTVRAAGFARVVAAQGWWAASRIVVGAVLATILIAPDWWPAAAPLAVGAHLLQRRMSRRPDVRLRLRRRHQLALTLEMIASCLAAGLVPATAVAVVLRARGDPLHSGRADAGDDPAVEALTAVSALLMVGAGSESAWTPAAQCPELAPLAAAAVRTARGGVALAAAFRDRAEALRQECARLETARSGRAGVLMTAPLGICFLPAFLCLGLAPVVIGLLGSLHLW